MNTMRDAANWAVLPTDGSPVAAYINGRWVCQDWARFGNAPRLPIMTFIPPPGVFAFGRQWATVDGATDAQWACQVCSNIIVAGGYICLDVEAGNAGQASNYVVGWADGIRAGGYKPVIYTSASFQHVLSAATTDWWLAGGDGPAFMYPGTVATQYAWDLFPGWDLSSVTDYFPSGPPCSVPLPSHIPFGMLGVGSTGDAVKDLQGELNASIDAQLVVDGLFGHATLAAVEDFQHAHNLTIDGIVGPTTEAALEAAQAPPALPPTPAPAPPPVVAPSYPAFPGPVAQGAKGDAVRAVQQRLHDRGWTLKVDGDFGPGTEAIVREFQAQKNLTVDGIAGPATWHALWADPITGS